MLNKRKIPIHPIELLFISISLLFSFWLMFHTFSYKDGSMLISQRVWSDFAGHIPLIRSFSYGYNFPPEYPLFSGEPIRYHFLFYLLVGLLEKIGFRIDWALNLPSLLSFFFLLLSIYLVAKVLFQSKTVGILSVLLFLFNGSLAFLEFLKSHPLSASFVSDIIKNNTFPSFGPYDGKIISAFWNLNIFTNQRHFALPLALLFFLVWLLLRFEKEKKHLSLSFLIFAGAILGLLAFSHSSVFVMAYCVFGMLFLLAPHMRKSIFIMLFIGGLIALPRILFLKETATFIPHLKIGYLIESTTLTIPHFFYYWFMNLGLGFLLAPLGVLLAPKHTRKIFLAFLPLFFLGNLIQFSIEIASNHKFFNTYLIVSNMFVAFFLVRLWKIHFVTKIVVPILLFFLLFSGILDFFPIKNDSKMRLEDYPKNPEVKWIVENTPKNSVFLNTTYLYHPASITGRKIFLGWPYFPWSLGYDTYTRDALRKKLLNPDNITLFCKNAIEYSIDYIAIERITSDIDFIVNKDFFESNFPKAYENKTNEFTIYSTKPTC